MRKFYWTIVIVCIILGFCVSSCGSSGSSSGKYSNGRSSYNADKGGRYGHGEQYDREVDYVANVFSH